MSWKPKASRRGREMTAPEGILDRLLLDITIRVLRFLVYDTGVNLIAGFIGGYAALYVMNRLNHNKERKKY